jgi:hypothetical protein
MMRNQLALSGFFANKLSGQEKSNELRKLKGFSSLWRMISSIESLKEGKEMFQIAWPLLHIYLSMKEGSLFCFVLLCSYEIHRT